MNKKHLILALDALLKPIGFTRRKSAWNRRIEDVIEVIEAQVSKSGDMVTLNAGVLDPTVHKAIWCEEPPDFLEDVRWLLGIERYVPADGIVYNGAFKIGVVEGGVALGGSATTGLFRRGGWANRGPNRIGVGKHNGNKVFRIAGDWVKNDSGHIDLFKLGKWP